MKKIFFISALLIIIITLFHTSVSAQTIYKQRVLGETATTEAQMIKEHQVIFPVADLGNCANINQCKAYCAIPANHDACANFGRKKGLYKENKMQTPPSLQEDQKKIALLQFARTELKCTSIESCKTLCQLPENQQKCSEFSRKHAMQEPNKTNLSKIKTEELLKNAKKELGCTSQETCKALCQMPENLQKCAEFAKKNGLGQQPSSSTPPTSKLLCLPRPACLDAAPACQIPEPADGWCPKTSGIQPGQNTITGPGGCRTVEECKAYYLKNTNQSPQTMQKDIPPTFQKTTPSPSTVPTSPESSIK